jgi:hypothetical protein
MRRPPPAGTNIEDATMTRNRTAGAALSALLFAQGLLGFAGLAAALLHRSPTAIETVVAAAPAVSAVR